jgi:membrane protease YdiL (CAAX protease family)
MQIGWIALWTLGAGLVLGLLRVYFRNILPAALNHALFDVLIYGNQPMALWWVW